jgi:hypothetical protein
MSYILVAIMMWPSPWLVSHRSFDPDYVFVRYDYFDTKEMCERRKVTADRKSQAVILTSFCIKEPRLESVR